jgi:GNAT superfamily N-acetyltransferase
LPYVRWDDEPHFVAGPRFFRDQHEFEHWHEIRLRGFTEWYVGRTAPRSFTNGRHVANAKARLFPEFLPQVRTDDGKPVAYLNTVPGFWCGDRQALHDLNYYDDTLQFGGLKTLLLGSSFLVAQRAGMLRAFDAVTTPFRNRKLSGANCIVLIGMTVDPAYQSMKLPSLLFSTVKEAARRLRMSTSWGPSVRMPTGNIRPRDTPPTATSCSKGTARDGTRTACPEIPG